MLFSSCHQAEKVQCVVRLGLFAFIHLRVKARASCRKKLASGLGRVYPVYHLSHITTAKEHCNQPTCLSHNNEAKRALQPTCPARDWRSVAICHTGFNTVHTCTMGLPWQRATKACPKLLVSSCPKDLRTNKSTENVGFSKQ